MSESRRNVYKHALLADHIGRTGGAYLVQPIDPFIGHQGGQPQQPNPAWIKKLLLATGVVILLHASVWYIARQLPTKPLPEPESEPVVIEIVKPLPKEEPPKVIEPEVIKPKIPPITKKPEIPPVVEKPQPVKKVVEQPKPVQKTTPAPTPTPKVVEQPVVEPVISENVRPVPVPAPQPAPAPAPVVAAPVEQNLPVTEAKGYAGYLSNPAPDYPEIALDRGWEGSVVLRVNVSASGSPISVSVKQGSGRKVLDDAAIRTVKRWKFSPALRGSTPIEGWVDVPIDYRLPR